ncbi:uncharacterized protein A1O9_05530 [Exophiala aquamarina CBS 119918]|uniref:Uncharacterized protein n=1 Tax=Exophiala aquamarina CBS 119918 TaxID=1182545 RepID=A0A072PCV5_9EURO|nr:uncharacterized protein A1O9_05530 [Exophiala aquamarina CBS 119918]KEF57612.1 hypothetical protein A1O9_05530 [Exophiala aquamarina CBS 119918]
MHSTTQQLQPTRVVVFDEEGSPVRHPESPTKGIGSSKRTALGELTPGTIAQRTRSAANQPVTRLPRDNSQQPRPRLSPDKVGRHFTIKVVGGEEWAARDVRFILWYYCRTALKFDSIATALNSTYPEADNQMTAEEAEAIVETIKSDWPRIKQNLTPGHFAIPEDWGWHPCDHLMICTSQQTQDRQSVMRSPRTRVAGVKLIKEILTTLWPGSWEELLQCPRTHHNIREAELELLSQPRHIDNRGFLVPSMVQESRRLDLILDETSLGDDTDQSVLDHEHDAESHLFHWVVRVVGGPKVLYTSIEVFLMTTFWFSLIAHWCYPLRPEKTYQDLIRISALNLESIVFMLYGAMNLVSGILKFLKIEVLVFHGVDESPPLPVTQKFRAVTIGVAAAFVLALWQGWLSEIHGEALQAWYKDSKTATWLRKIPQG